LYPPVFKELLFLMMLQSSSAVVLLLMMFISIDNTKMQFIPFYNNYKK